MSGDPTGRQTVARSGAVMAAGTMTSRVLGLVRSVLLASIVGLTGLTADAWDTANTLPNQFYLILAGGVLNAVLVPQIVRAMARPDGGVEFVNRIVTLAVAFFLASTVVLTLLAPVLVRVYFNTDDPAAIRLAVAFAWICLPQIFFYALYTVLGQILNAHHRFTAYMWAPVAANLVALAGLLLFRLSGQPSAASADTWTPQMVWILAGSATLSIAVQALALIPPLRRMGFRYRPVWGVRGVGLGAASRVAKWTFAAVIVSQLGYVVTANVLTRASDLAHRSGVVAPGKQAFSQAFLLFIVAHSVVTVSIVTALFTRMSRAAAEADRTDLVADVRRGLRMPAIILVPGVVFGMVFGELITRTLFFLNGRADTNAIASVMVPMLLGVLPFGWLYLSERFFYAHEDARTPFIVQCIVTGTAAVVTLLGALAPPRWTAPVVGLGQSLAYLTGAVVAFTLMRRRIGRLGLGRVVRTYVRLLLAAGVVAVALWLPLHLWVDLDRLGRLGGAVLLCVMGALQLGLSLIGAHLLGVTEVAAAVEPVARRLRRR